MEKKKNIAVLSASGGGEGATYTAGKNISISEANEISVVDNMSDVTSIEIKPWATSGKPTILTDYNYKLYVKNKADYCPSIRFCNDVYSYNSVEFKWERTNWGNFNYITFPFNYEYGTFYVFMSRSTIPDVPKSDGTYVLKATVSSGTLTYSWVKEGE